jgi:4-alpha-glucanotransferase
MQVQKLYEHVSAADGIWYIDLPLGVSRSGYDTWQAKDAFALRADGGAPPDAFFSQGQRWGFPPIHPEGIRRQGYRYFITMLRRHLARTKLLRIDHAARLHRLFWIPQGMEATNGAYVRYRSEELYAILAIESHRAGAGIIGENLGTVPEYVNRGLRRHGVRGMYILPFEIHPNRRPPVSKPKRGNLTALNTHDMPTFAAFWKDADIAQRVRLGLLPARSRAREHRARSALKQSLRSVLRRQGLLRRKARSVRQVLAACFRWLANSEGEVVLVNLEDLWLETKAQNIPGTTRQHPNWRRKAAMSLEAFQQDRKLLRLLRAVQRNPYQWRRQRLKRRHKR